MIKKLHSFKVLYLLIFSLLSINASAQVAPLLKTNWGQGCGFNELMPVMTNPTNCNKAAIGCSGVALAQIMKYWQYPSKGNSTFYYKPVGTNSSILINADTMLFDWTKIGDTLNQSGKSNLALQKLIYNAAIINDTKFGLSSGGALGGYNYSLEGIDYFVPRLFANLGYSLKNQYLECTDFTQSALENIVKNQLDNKIPVIMTITNKSNNNSHGVIIDGYKNTTPIQFHINTGWNGKYNGYYTLDNLNFPIYGEYLKDGIYINIKPKTDAIEIIQDTLFFEKTNIYNQKLIFKSNKNWTITLNDNWFRKSGGTLELSLLITIIQIKG